MIDMVKVSILVPVYGVERYIENCAVTLFEQTYENIEYVFVNDSTKDRSMEILHEVMERYPLRRDNVHIITHEVNRGLGAARNTALLNATGDFVMHVDSDDSLSLDAVEMLVDKAIQTGADIVDCGYEKTNNGKVVSTHIPFHGTHDNYLRIMLCQNIVSNRIWGRLYRRSLFSDYEINPIDGVDYGEDFAIVPRLMYYAKRVWVDSPGYKYRTENDSSYTHSFTKKSFVSMWRASAIVYGFFQTRDVEKKYDFALQMGMLNMIRAMRKNDYKMDILNSFCNYRANGLIPGFIAKLFMGSCPYPIANIFYLITRRLYAMFILKSVHLPTCGKG